MSWLPCWFGVIAGAVPWVAIALHLVAPGIDVAAPGLVYGIFFSLFVFFNAFALVMVLQYRQVGRWADYKFGEYTYVLLRLVAKSACMAGLRRDVGRLTEVQSGSLQNDRKSYRRWCNR